MLVKRTEKVLQILFFLSYYSKVSANTEIMIHDEVDASFQTDNFKSSERKYTYIGPAFTASSCNPFLGFEK